MARKYRPRSFGEVVGQPHVVHTLENALRKGRFAHAYIFSGPRGVGKTTMARILARALNCVNGPTPSPCGECGNCREIITGNSLDVLEIDAASNRGIDEIRNLRDNVRYSPAGGKFRVYIIDEIHMLTPQAFNAFLKTLEEPPAHAVFIGATTEIEQVPRTVLSRMQRFNFRLVSLDEIAGHLQYLAGQENIDIEEEAINILASRANGSLRDGIGLLDQLAAYCDGKITAEEIRSALGVIDSDLYFRAAEAVRGDNSADIFRLVDDLSQSGIDPAEFMRGFSAHYRDLLMVKTAGSNEILQGSDLYRQKMSDCAGNFSDLDLVRLMKAAFEASQELKRSQIPILNLELRLLTMQKLHDAPELKELLKQMKDQRKAVSDSDTGNTYDRDITNIESSKNIDIATEVDTTETKNKDLFNKSAEKTEDKLIMKESSVRMEKTQVSAADDTTSAGLDRIKNVWDRVCEMVEAENKFVGITLRNASPTSLTGKNLEITFYNGLISRVKSAINIVIKIIKDLTGMTVNIRCVKGKQIPGNIKNEIVDSRSILLNALMEQEPLLKEMVERLGLEPA